ncbi:hypothetical protein EVJ58_g6536 [Rhodofomes roseus]|uniref:F-box domain-containing protein n=1 Tax=Rhodofomes roseus TaxID=34475 RepID=A0A4Y9Y856_9APHY|nr:hypothetical protein EVJ58_g6536 [Rhodofomes roseus]
MIQFLKPLDLANLAQTNRAFRATLTSPPASKIWATARKYTANVPECPQGVSEITWARFIHEPPKCDKCRVLDIRNLDFALMRRLCDRCKLKTSRQTLIHDLANVHPGDRFYRKTDVVAMAKVYDKFQRDIDMSSTNAVAKKAMQQFECQRTKAVQTILEHAKKCTEWLREFEVYLHNEAQERIAQYYEQIARRFREMGHEDQDIKNIRSMPEAMRDRPVTEQVWKKLKPALQMRIEMSRCKRLDQDENDVIDSRKALVYNVYLAYKQTLRPIERSRLSPPKLIYAIPAFRELIYTKLDVELTQAACDEAAKRLPEYLSMFTDKLRNSLVQSMADNGVFEVRNRRTKRPPKGAHDRLALATSVFRVASHGSSLFSYNGITTYLDSIWTAGKDSGFWIAMYETLQPKFEFDKQASAAVEALMLQLGLDPATTRPEDLDRLHKRFFCEFCGGRPRYRFPGDVAYPWQAAIGHCIACPGSFSSSTPYLRLLNEDECKSVRKLEEAKSYMPPHTWECNHCPGITYHLRVLPDVLEHIRTAHGISEPEEDVDYFHAYRDTHYNPIPQSFSESLKLAEAQAANVARPTADRR